MTGVVLGKPNFEAMTTAEFKSLLNALISAGYVSLDTLRPQIDAFFQSDLANTPRTPQEDAQVDPDIVGDHFYDLFQTITFGSADEVVAHYQTYQNRSLPFTDKLYDWSTIEGDYGYRLAVPAGHPVRTLMELVIDAAREGNALLKWDDAPVPEVSFMCLCQFGIFINLRPCPPRMVELIARQPRYAQVRDLLAGVFGVAPQIYAQDEQ